MKLAEAQVDEDSERARGMGNKKKNNNNRGNFDVCPPNDDHETGRIKS